VSPSTYIITVNEGPNTVNATIININATDKDAGSNATIIYELTSGDEHGFFNLDPNTVCYDDDDDDDDDE